MRRMNWQDIATLQQDRMDIESHTMDHKPPHHHIICQVESSSFFTTGDQKYGTGIPSNERSLFS